MEVVAVTVPAAGTDRNVAVAGTSFTSDQIQSLPYIGNTQDAFLKSVPGTPSGGFNFHESENGVDNFVVDGAEVRSANGGMQTLGLSMRVPKVASPESAPLADSGPVPLLILFFSNLFLHCTRDAA